MNMQDPMNSDGFEVLVENPEPVYVLWTSRLSEFISRGTERKFISRFEKSYANIRLSMGKSHSFPISSWAVPPG
jgi:hypothetical protein